ncbi:hypothetical protein HYH03_008758 [Edaphochlamys debaryana]|uniref:EF-hand domain-containing protein n=1 Tax=Edaphochlamys debaryana TaxID=47281 RepID=A0A835XZV7_9CHLO|nr:hypothetical protein HYH03_008758 [Edaphochlamys debaryana]|eukprot:KAG2493095.1 hypothetical protein HYH03_008758 [Edaphochlamys debaryana]
MAEKGSPVGTPSTVAAALGKACLDHEYDHEDRPSAQGNHITLERFNSPTRKILQQFDDNGDGRIDATEIQAVVSTLVAEKFKSKAFKIGLIILGVFTVVLLGAMFGLTWAVVAALKDTEVQNNILVTNDGGQPVQVANMDMTVKNGRLVDRNSSNVLSTGTVSSRGVFSTAMSMQKLLKISTLAFTLPDGAEYSVNVLGVAKIPKLNANSGFIIRFQTASGTLTLENGEWAASDLQGPILEPLFASDTSGRRRLLQEGSAWSAMCYGFSDCGEEYPTDLLCATACTNVDQCQLTNPCGYCYGCRQYYPSTPTEALPPPPDMMSPGEVTETGGIGTRCSGVNSGPVSSCRDAYTMCYGTQATLQDAQSKIALLWQCTSNCPSGWALAGAPSVTMGQSVNVSLCEATSGPTFTWCC